MDKEEIVKVLREQVLKRETLEGERADTASRRIRRKSTAESATDEDEDEDVAADPGPPPVARVPPSAV